MVVTGELRADTGEVPVECVTAVSGATTIQVCLDRNGDARGTHVIATSVQQPVSMTVHSIWVEQCNNGGNPLSCSVVTSGRGYSVSGSGVVTTTWGAFNYSFGHTYKGCANVTVAGGPTYGGVCSVLVAN